MRKEKRESKDIVDFDAYMKKKSELQTEKNGPSFAGGIINISSKMKKNHNEE